MRRIITQARWLLSCLHYALITARMHRPTVRDVMRYAWAMRDRVGY